MCWRSKPTTVGTARHLAAVPPCLCCGLFSRFYGSEARTRDRGGRGWWGRGIVLCCVVTFHPLGPPPLGHGYPLSLLCCFLSVDDRNGLHRKRGVDWAGGGCSGQGEGGPCASIISRQTTHMMHSTKYTMGGGGIVLCCCPPAPLPLLQPLLSFVEEKQQDSGRRREERARGKTALQVVRSYAMRV